MVDLFIDNFSISFFQRFMRSNKIRHLTQDNLHSKDVNNNEMQYLKKAIYVDLVKDGSQGVLYQNGYYYIENICTICKNTKRKKSCVLKIPYKRKKYSQKRVDRELRSLSYNIKKINTANHIVNIMRKLHEKEHRIIIQLNRKRQPKFRVISKSDLKGMLNKLLD